MKHDYELDTFGLSCPVPIMKVAEEFKNIPEGSVLKIVASDEGIVEDLKSYCKKTNHEFLSYEISLPEYIVYVRK